MINNRKVLGVIPARGGSKRLPHKNMACLAGRPLIVHTIEAGLGTRYIDELIVSTEDAEIANIATKAGARVPFIRPSFLAQDSSTSVDVVSHAIEYYKDAGHSFDYVVLLQPTSPLRRSADIDQAVIFMQNKKADAVISVAETAHSPLWANTLPESLEMNVFLREDVKYKRSQELDKYYQLNGAIYICSIPRLLAEKSFFIKDNIFAYIMPREKSVDIDTQLDLEFCEFLMGRYVRSE